MDTPQREQIKSQLRTFGEDAETTLVLSVLPPAKADVSVLDPSNFPSRADYRKALVEQQDEASRGAVDDLIFRLQGLGLKSQPAYLSHSVVVKGGTTQLEAALDLPEVQDVVLDFPIAPIKPR